MTLSLASRGPARQSLGPWSVLAGGNLALLVAAYIGSVNTKSMRWVLVGCRARRLRQSSAPR